MREKLTDINSIENVIRDMTLEEKLNLVGAYEAGHTLPVTDMGIPSITMFDGATGINGAQIGIDYVTSPKRSAGGMQTMDFTMLGTLRDLVKADLDEAKKAYEDEPYLLNYIKELEEYRPRGKSMISFPSGINIGASFDPQMAYEAGRAVGTEMRDSGIDVCLGPNVDIFRDPLGGRGYEMYGEDPKLVGDMAVSFIQGVQAAGTAACAKHFIANNQETNRNTKDTHVSKRTLMEIYSVGFERAVKEADVKAVMSAYNAINGTFTSYSKELLTDLLRNRWGFEGLVVSDWGAAANDKEHALLAGMGLILCGPNDMEQCKRAVLNGELPEEILNERVYHILKLILELKEMRKKEIIYDQKKLLETARKTVVQGAVLLKNEGQVLPMRKDTAVTFYGKSSREMLECGSGSTFVSTNLHSNVYEEAKCKAPEGKVSFENMQAAEVVVYTVTAPAGENIDRDCMDVENCDRERIVTVLKEAKEKGKRTVVILNIAGPVDMRRWIDYADSVLCIFVPGCMGGKAAADLLYGDDYPGGKLPISMPLRYQDTPSYPNFPGELNDVYYGEGIFVGYRSYEKREIPVLYPFGHGLSYTEFEVKIKQRTYTLDLFQQDFFKVAVSVKNIGKNRGSEVIQIYYSEQNPHLLRPIKELAGFAKTELNVSEEKTVEIVIRADALRCYDPKLDRFVNPIGNHMLYVGTSSQKIIAEIPLLIIGQNEYVLGADSPMYEVMESSKAVEVINELTDGLLNKINEDEMQMMAYMPLSAVLDSLISIIPDAVQLAERKQQIYRRIAEIF